MYLFDKVWIITFSIMYGPHNDSNDHVTKTGTTLNINWYQALKLGLAVSNRIFIYIYIYIYIFIKHAHQYITKSVNNVLYAFMRTNHGLANQFLIHFPFNCYN